MKDSRVNKKSDISDDRLPDKKKYIRPVIEEDLELPTAAAQPAFTTLATDQ